jgi:hypothetical protein
MIIIILIIFKQQTADKMRKANDSKCGTLQILFQIFFAEKCASNYPVTSQMRANPQ